MSAAQSTKNSTSTSTTITGLQGLTQYAIVVVATNSAGLTSTSATLTATTLVDPNAPSAVTLMPSAIANTSFGLVWAVPSSAGKESNGTTDATISSYKVFYQEGTSLDYSSATELAPSNAIHDNQNGREVIITGLIINTQYTIGVRTTNSAGATSTSNTVTLRTKNYTKLGADGSVLTIQDGTWSYDSSGNDNGTENAGTLWSCVRDEGTGLVWEVKTNKATADARDKDLTYQWGGLTAIGRDDNPKTGTYYDDWNALVLHANAQQFTADANDGDATEANADSKTVLCGTSGNNWRVPNLMELSTIINYNTHSPAYDNAVFPNGQLDSYWSSSPYANNSHNAWRVHFGYGYDYSHVRDANSYVRLVRGDSVLANFDDSRYTNNNNGTITDTKTGLVWKQCSEGQSAADCSTDSEDTYNYEDAKARARLANEEDSGVGFAGNSDWRLPTIQEMRTLVAFDRHSPSINTTMFPNTIQNYYWSSSPYASHNSSAWSMHFGYGNDLNFNRTNSFYVRLVRGSQ